MARKKTPSSKQTNKPDQTDEATAGATGEVISVTDAETVDATGAPNFDDARTGDDPETVEAEIVSEPAAQDAVRDDAADADAVETRPADGGSDDDVVRTDTAGGGGGAGTTDGGKKRKRGFPWGAIAALVLIGVIGWIVYSLIDDDDDVQVAEADPGLVVTDAEPFPGNELDGERDTPIRGEAAPGTRRAAREADAARDGAALPPISETAENVPFEVAERDDAGEAEGDTISALRARAAERRAQRDARADEDRDAGEARDGTPFYVADGDDETGTQPPAADRDGDRDARQAERPAGDDMAARVAAARAAQARIRREDEARRAAVRADDDAADTASRRTQDTDEADPNALPQFTEDEDEPTTTVFGRDDAADPRERSSDDDQFRTTRRSAPRPTGRVTPLGSAAPAEADDDQDDRFADDRDDEDRLAAERAADDERAAQRAADLVRERMAAERDDAPRFATLPEEAATEEELDARISEVRAGLREDVLAETEARIRTAIEETEREVEEIREELTEQEERSNERIAQLTDRLEVLQRRDATASQQGVLILALSGLAGTIERGEPFERQLDDVERLAPNARSLRRARAYAAEGLATDLDLSERFQDVARRALAAEGRAGAEDGLGAIWANLRGLFTVRPVGEVEGDTPSAIISRAEAALDRGDLAGAVRELNALDGAAEEAFEPWMADARAKVDVIERVDRLERAVLARDG